MNQEDQQTVFEIMQAIDINVNKIRTFVLYHWISSVNVFLCNVSISAIKGQKATRGKKIARGKKIEHEKKTCWKWAICQKTQKTETADVQDNKEGQIIMLTEFVKFENKIKKKVLSKNFQRKTKHLKSTVLIDKNSDDDEKEVQLNSA